ncbi:MAG: AAA family ATPase [Nanoarchaeota archaeon]|nr:AAA family ATPase [Nanoarchaeota archaeon]
MILKSIKLENIRSYVSESIQFPSGSTMLSGDIGSGKSTILLAAEFALFGIRSDLKGESLLRHGKDKGSVEMLLSIAGKDITIKRGLKRTNKSVQQDTGHIILDGKMDELTAVELKTRIMGLLGYPKDLVSKSKQLVYRYTVYTPQEQMKEILFDDSEERLNTLRRVFGIDKYKTIIENTSIITKQLKMRTKELAGSIYDLEEKKNLVNERRSELKKAEQGSKEVIPLLEKAKQELIAAKSSIEKSEKEIKELNDVKNKLSISDTKLKEKLTLHQRNSKEIEMIESQINEIEKKSQEQPMIKIPEQGKRESLMSTKAVLEKELNISRLKINELEINKRNSASVKEKISKLSNCPTCLQHVPEDYKNSIITRESAEEKRLSDEAASLRSALSEKEKQLLDIAKEIETLIQEEKRYERIKAESESSKRILNEKAERKRTISEMQDQIKKDVALINAEKIQLSEKITLLSASEENYKREKASFDSLKEKEKQFELRKMSFDKEAEGIMRIISTFDKEIAEKEKAKDRIIKLKQTQEWLDTSFVILMAVIEKHIMAKVYEEFNDLFQEWFRIMIDDEALSVSLDHDFTPLVTQDGYETFVEHLSGGEKTAIALAYRLSLNRVINDIIGTIKTKDIIILDEPTDGFSSEQLDKVREVIDQLGMKQIILVSHEPKIEGFVENILRVEKRGHVSSIIS